MNVQGAAQDAHAVGANSIFVDRGMGCSGDLWVL